MSTSVAITSGQWAEQWSRRPKLRGWLHAAALPAVLAATASLAHRHRPHRKSLAAYAAGLSAMLATSAGYHRLTRTEAHFRWTQPADHAMIFAAIAGTATPIIDATVPRRAAPYAIAGVWAAAAVGATQRVLGLRHGTHGGAAAYGVLGWAGLLLLPGVVRKGGLRVAGLLGAGGACYTVGALMFSRRWPNPAPGVFGYHEVWHVATVAGVLCHLVAISALTDADYHPGASAVPAAVSTPMSPAPGTP